MYAYVEIDLRDIDTSDLVQELHNRKVSKDLYSDFSLGEIIRNLKALDCPSHIIEQVEAWSKEPLASPEKLIRWKELCGV